MDDLPVAFPCALSFQEQEPTTTVAALIDQEIALSNCRYSKLPIETKADSPKGKYSTAFRRRLIEVNDFYQAQKGAEHLVTDWLRICQKTIVSGV